MKGDRTTVPEALVNRYGLSLRLAARIVALLAKRLDVSPTLLEMAGSDETLERLLLDRRLLGDPGALTEEQLRARAGEYGFADGELLRLVDGEDGWRTLAQEDDVLAEQAQADQGGSPAGTGLIRAAEAGMSRLETEDLFTPEEVARLKLAALTSQTSEERIEAMRKLVFAPLAATQKVGIFVNVLVDATAGDQVRREAIESLERIGFRSDLAEAIRGLFEAGDEEVLYAVGRLGALLKEAEEAEAGVTLAVILDVFSESGRTPVVLELLQLTARSASVLATSAQKTEQFLQSALRHLTLHFDELCVAAEEAIRACWEQIPDVIDGVLWREIERSQDARVRAFLVNVFSRLTSDVERFRKLSGIAVDEILNPRLPEAERSDLRYSLVRMGEGAVAAVLSRLRATKGPGTAELVRLLDTICTGAGVSEKAINEAVQMLLELLQVGEQTTRRRILEAAILSDERIAEPVREKVARELLAHLTEFRLPTTLELIDRNIERLGPSAAEPLFEYARKRYPNDEAERAFLSLARIVRMHDEAVPDKLARTMIEHCLKLFESPGARLGGSVIVLASLCGHTKAGADAFDRVLAAMKDRLQTARYTVSLFEALGIMAGSPNVQAPQQEELFEMFERILSVKAPEVLGVKRETDEGTVYEFGKEVLYETRVVPTVVQGLESICVSDHATLQMRADIVKRLLVLWEGVSNVRVVWGPAGVEALIRAMSSAACCTGIEVDMRVRLGRSLLRFLNKVSVARSMGDICAIEHGGLPMQELCLDAAGKMLSEWEHCDQQDDERKVALLRSLGRTAANTVLDKDHEEVARMRDNVLDALFQGLREGFHEVRAPLEALESFPDLTKKQRDDIHERLSRAYGLMRIHRD